MHFLLWLPVQSSAQDTSLMAPPPSHQEQPVAVEWQEAPLSLPHDMGASDQPSVCWGLKDTPTQIGLILVREA